MQGEWEGEVEEEPEWISSSDSDAADPDSESGESPPNLQAIAAVVLQDVREREQYAQIVARAGGIEPGRRPAPEQPRARERAQERERRQLEIARRYREERRQQQERERAERQRARELVQEYRINIRAAAKRIAREDPVQRRVEERRRGEEQRSRSPLRDRNQPTRS